MQQTDNHLEQAFTKLGFDGREIILNAREQDSTLTVCSARVPCPQTTHSSDFLYCGFEIWRSSKIDPPAITCLYAALLRPTGSNSDNRLLASKDYYSFDDGIPPVKEVIADLMDLQKRKEINEKFNLGGDPVRSTSSGKKPSRP